MKVSGVGDDSDAELYRGKRETRHESGRFTRRTPVLRADMRTIRSYERGYEWSIED